MVDEDGVRVLPLNILSKYPPDDIKRGTLEIFYEKWASKLRVTPSSPDSERTVISQGLDPRAPFLDTLQPVLLAFSGERSTLADALIGMGFEVDTVDKSFGPDHDLTRASCQDAVLYRVSSGYYGFVFLSPPCKSFSVSHDERPLLRSTHWPRGIRPLPRAWHDYILRHNKLADFSASCILAAHDAGVPWAIENPASRSDVSPHSTWSRFARHGTLWDLFAAGGLAPPRLQRSHPSPFSVPVLEVTFAMCAFGAPFQKYTTIWASAHASPLSVCFAMPLAPIRAFSAINDFEGYLSPECPPLSNRSPIGQPLRQSWLRASNVPCLLRG